MGFPERIFGKCPVHGGGGIDDPEEEDQHSTEDHAGSGYPLIYYQGRLMCKMCAKRLSNDAESKESARRYNEEQKFWNKMGVKKNMSD